MSKVQTGPRGFFAIGVYHPKTEANIGTLWRSAHAFGASMIFTVGMRYKRQSSDTSSAWKHVPLMHFSTIDDLVAHLPYDCLLAGIELEPTAYRLGNYVHREQACYLLGAEDYGLPPNVLAKCHQKIEIPGASRCLNVAVAGSIVMYDRVSKGAKA